MNKTQKIDALISNEGSTWTEEDRPFLNKLDDTVLDGMLGKNASADDAEDEADGGADDAEENPDGSMKKGAKGKSKKPTGNEEAETEEEAEEPTDNEEKPVTVNEYIANAPAEIQDVLRSSMATHNAAKAKLIKTITSNKANVFTKEQLARKSLEELTGLAALAASSQSVARRQPRYDGQADGPIDNEGDNTPQEVLDSPVMNFGKGKGKDSDDNE